MNFKDLLAEYELKLDYVKRMKQPDALSFYHKTEEYWNGYLRSSFEWFQDMKLFCDDFNPEIKPLSKEEKNIYENQDDSLVGVLDYRNQKVLVYSDDYGQQLFIVIDNKKISGGSYNIGCVYDFCYSIDEKLDLNY